MAYGLDSHWQPSRQRDWTAADWNGGACDVVAVALSRMYGLPMAGLFERIREPGSFADIRDRKDTGFLLHAFCILPDGRAIDAGGPREAMRDDPGHRDPDDPHVDGAVVRLVDERTAFLVDERQFDYASDVDCMGAGEWVLRHLGPTLEGLGVPLRTSGMGLPDEVDRTLRIATGTWHGPDEHDETAGPGHPDDDASWTGGFSP